MTVRSSVEMMLTAVCRILKDVLNKTIFKEGLGR